MYWMHKGHLNIVFKIVYHRILIFHLLHAPTLCRLVPSSWNISYVFFDYIIDFVFFFFFLHVCTLNSEEKKTSVYVHIMVLIFSSVIYEEMLFYFPRVVKVCSHKFHYILWKIFLAKKNPYSSCQISRLSLIIMCFAPSAAFFPVSRQCGRARAPANAI